MLGFGLLLVSALNSLIVIYVLRQQKPAAQNKAAARPDKEADEESKEKNGTEQETTPSSRSEVTQPVQVPPKSKRPTTKAEILAWRAGIIQDIERERGTKVITMIHKKELWSGADEEPEIGIEDSDKILQEFRKTPSGQPIDLILHTPGGYATAAQMMAMAIKFHRGKVTVMVPFYAMSGGSLMSLAADEIRMEKYSVLGPVDPQIPTPDGMWPASSLATLLRTKPIQNITDRMVIMSDVANLETENAKTFVLWLIEGKMDKEQAERVADFLARGYMSHATPITLDVARAMGLNVVEGIPEKVYELFKTFAFTGQDYRGKR
jgi:ClpP class serine protease